MPLSHFGMGLMSFLLLVNWVSEWNWKVKWERLRNNASFLVLSSFFLVYCIGLVCADNLPKAFQELVSMLVVFFAPVVVATSKPLDVRERHFILGSFVLSTFVGCVCSLIYWRTHEVADFRHISIFVDHIRFSLCIVMSIVFSVYFLLNESSAHYVRIISTCFLILFLLAYMFIAQTLTGILILMVIAVAYGIYLAVCIHNGRCRKLFFLSLWVCLLALTSYVTWITYDYFRDRDKVIAERVTPLGNPYTFEENSMVENGHRVSYYVCDTELRAAWSLRSDTVLSDLHKLTLVRYLNSKGLHKDFASVMELSDEDVRNIEKGIANCAYTGSFGLRRALYPTFFSLSLYKQCRFLYDSSLLLRVEMWRMSWSVIRDNWFLGVGLGDNKDALKAQCVKTNSPAFESHKQGCHNQFLTFWMCGGILVVLYFLFVLFYPFVKMRPKISFLYVAFFLLIFLSFFTEDTLQSQTGCMLFAIMNPVLLSKLASEDS